MRYISIIALACFAITLGGCASGYHPALPQLMGPADFVDCTITREDDVIGFYECTIKGRYKMENPGLF